jgi:thiamine-phosphate pyrophosphorylase
MPSGEDREQRRQAFLQTDLYPVTDQGQSRGRSSLEVLEGLIAGGARIVQLREKHLSKRELCRLAADFRERTDRAGVLLIINDHLDVALACGADGVHLGQDDLPLEAARRIAPELIIGVSTHNIEEALAAQEQGADYVNIGPIFPTGTKQLAIPPLGPEAIAGISPRLMVPFTVMGGINRSNIARVLKAGARRVAVVTAVTLADDVSQAVRELRGLIRKELAAESFGESRHQI